MKNYETRLVAQGFIQQEGLQREFCTGGRQFDGLFISVHISPLPAIADQYNWEIDQMYVVTAFLHGGLVQEVYMKMTPYMQVDNSESKVLKMKIPPWLDTKKSCMGEDVQRNLSKLSKLK